MGKTGTADRFDDEGRLSRRPVLLGAGALASVATAGGAWAKKGLDHAKHAPQRPDLLASLEACSSAGRLCITLCLVTVEEGDTTLAACARKVQEVTPLCEAMGALVGAKTSYVRGIAQACIDA